MNPITNPMQLINVKLSEEKAAMAIVKHELRNSLAVIKLNAQLLEKTVKKNEKYSPNALAAIIVRSIDGITNILDQYLAENNDEDYALTDLIDFDLDELIRETLQNFEMLHPGNAFIYPYNLKIPVRANRHQIGQVLVNYITNALKYSPENSRISLMVHTGYSGVDVGVIDEGIGVPVGQEQKIFERYYKIDQCPDSNNNSRGLGLFLVKEIIDRHHGAVWLQRARSGGSIFFFRLPLKS